MGNLCGMGPKGDNYANQFPQVDKLSKDIEKNWKKGGKGIQEKELTNIKSLV